MIHEDNYDVLIGIDRRGVAKVLKHRNCPISRVKAEVSLTVTTVETQTFTSEEVSDTGLLGPLGTLPRSGRVASRSVAVGPESVRAVLDRAIESGAWVEIIGTKVDGDRYTRRVWPLSIYQQAFSPHDYLYCKTEDGTRTYRVDGIESAQAKAGA